MRSAFDLLRELVTAGYRVEIDSDDAGFVVSMTSDSAKSLRYHGVMLSGAIRKAHRAMVEAEL